MNDLISRQAAIDAILEQTVCATKRELVERCDANISDENGWLGGVCIALDTIEDLPSAQPVRKKGEWIPHKSIFGGLDEKVYTCNKCGCNIGFHTENFCPNCGSYNGGEEE